MTKEEAIKRIQEHMIIHEKNEPRAIYITKALQMAIEALEQQPKKGHWERRLVDYKKCSECGHIVNFYRKYNYCPNCGAKMVEPQESEEEK